MDNRYYGKVVEEMNSFFEENGFKPLDDGFASESKAIKIEYDEEKQIYKLLVADIEEGKIGDYELASAYLFDDSQNEKDAASVGIDFVDTLRKKLGIKAARKNFSGNIEIATVKKGDAVKKGDVLASAAENALSLPIHAPEDGVIADVNDKCITITLN